jgi:hypothetical protein
MQMTIWELQKNIYGPPLQDYIRSRLGWTREQIDDTNWAIIHGALQSYPLHGRTTRMKAIYGWLHTHRWKARIYSTTSTCPFCDEEESNDHIWICPATTMNRQHAMAQFMASIQEKTPPIVSAALQQRLNVALSLPPIEYQDDHSDELGLDGFILAVAQQDDLGWINFIRGRQTIQWEEAYDEYLGSTQRELPCKSGRTWATKLGIAALTMLVQIWHGRNDQFHRSEGEEGDLPPRIQAIHQRVRETYSDKLMFSRAMRAKLFDIPLENRLEQWPFQLVKWLETVDTTARVPLPGTHKTIFSYFHPTRPPDQVLTDIN